MFGFHQFAHDGKGGPRGAPSVGLPGANSLPDIFVSRHPDAGIPEPADPSEPVLGEILACIGSGFMGEFRDRPVHPGRWPVRQPHACRPRTDPCKRLRELPIAASRAVTLVGVVQQPQRQWPVDIDPDLAQMPEFPLNFWISMGSRCPGELPVEAGKACKIAAQRRPVLVLPGLHRPPAEPFIGAIDAVDLARPPPKDVPKERVGAFRRMRGAQETLYAEPMIVVKVLLLRIRKSHEQPVLDLLALRERSTGGIQALEYLLRILLVVKTDADHPEPLKAPEQASNVISGDETTGDPPSLGYRAGTGRLALEAAPVFVLVPVLQSQLAAFLRWFVRIGQPIVEDDLLGPAVAFALRSKFRRDTGKQNAHGRQSLLAVDDADSRHHAGRARVRKGEERAAVVRRI